jgi:2-C-methyl-D-erythritol 4-phosphate cytidylyltransferase
VLNGINALSDEIEYIAVHDGVRAMATKKLIIRAMLAAEEHDAVIPVVDVIDSYRRVEGNESHIVPRAELRIVQTPQIFKAQTLRNAYSVAFSPAFTDDASVIEAAGGHITLVEGERTNIKLTTPEDMAYAEWLLTREQ